MLNVASAASVALRFDPLCFDPLCVDPLCVDPLCVDPLCVDPLCVDPLCVDPLCFGSGALQHAAQAGRSLEHAPQAHVGAIVLRP
jgi:hypothetical protein